MTFQNKHQTILFLALLTVVGSLWGCRSASENEVIVYTALDQQFSEPHFKMFTEQTGIPVVPKFDTEANKTVGLTTAILAEKNRPRCDLFWNNEILNTLRLEKAGLLDVYFPKNRESFPAEFRSAEGHWSGFAARARVLIINTDKIKPADLPESIFDLADPAWKGQCGFAKPLFGTTATHAAVLFATLGEEKATQFFTDLKANARMMPGNKQVALAVSNGQLAFGLTDTDDAIIEIERGMPVAIVYPVQGADQLGTLFIPNTLAIIKNGPNTKAAQQLVDYLLTAEVETALSQGPSAQIPLNKNIDIELRVESPQTIKSMQVDFHEAANHWNTAAAQMEALFLAP